MERFFWTTRYDPWTVGQKKINKFKTKSRKKMIEKIKERTSIPTWWTRIFERRGQYSA